MRMSAPRREPRTSAVLEGSGTRWVHVDPESFKNRHAARPEHIFPATAFLAITLRCSGPTTFLSALQT